MAVLTQIITIFSFEHFLIFLRLIEWALLYFKRSKIISLQVGDDLLFPLERTVMLSSVMLLLVSTSYLGIMFIDHVMTFN